MSHIVKVKLNAPTPQNSHTNLKLGGFWSAGCGKQETQEKMRPDCRSFEHLYKKEQTGSCSYWNRQANSGLLSLFFNRPFVREVRICGAEIVQFVSNRWKRNIPRRRSPALAVNSSGRASLTLMATVKKNMNSAGGIADCSYDPGLRACGVFQSLECQGKQLSSRFATHTARPRDGIVHGLFAVSG